MTQPGQLGNLRPRGKDAVVREIEALKAEVQRLKAAVGGLKSPDFNGTSFANPGTTGNYFGADGAVLNNLYLRPGSVGNDALTNPIIPAVGHIDTGGYSLTTSATVKASMNFTVPAGFTQAAVFATTVARARNKNTVQDYLGGYASINGVTHGLDSADDGQPGYTVEITNAASTVLTGLTGGSTFFVRTLLYSGAANWVADSFNGLNLDALVLFLR